MSGYFLSFVIPANTTTPLTIPAPFPLLTLTTPLITASSQGNTRSTLSSTPTLIQGFTMSPTHIDTSHDYITVYIHDDPQEFKTIEPMGLHLLIGDTRRGRCPLPIDCSGCPFSTQDPGYICSQVYWDTRTDLQATHPEWFI